MVRLKVAEQQQQGNSGSNSNSNSNKKISGSNSSSGNSNPNNNNNNNDAGSCASNTSSNTSLNSSSNNNSSNSSMAVPHTSPQQLQQPQQQQQQQQQQQPLPPLAANVAVATVAVVPAPANAVPYAAPQHHSPSDGSNCSLPASPPLLQQTPTPPQGAQIVPPVCALHHPQQLALMAAMQHHMLPPPHVPPPHALHHVAPPPQPGITHENGHAHAHGGGISPSGGSSSASSVSSVSSGGGIQSNGASNGTNGIGPPPVPASALPPGPLYIQYQSEFYPPEYYMAPHPHEGICPQHPHHPHAHHHQPMCAMSAEYGPTAVQMVSQNRPPPPMPVPVQVPQYVNENGTLTHVMLSPQQYQQLHPGQGHIHAAPFITTNGTSHFYTPLPGYPPGPGGNGPPHYHMPPPPQAAQQQQPTTVAPQQAQQQPPQNQVTHSPHSPSPPNYKDERSQRQHTKLLRKLEKQRELNSAMSTPTHSPSPRRNDINGHHNNIPPGAVPMSHLQHINNHHHVQNHARRLPQRNGTHVPNAAVAAATAAGVANATLPQQQRAGSSVGGASSVGTSEDGEDTSSLAAEDEEDYQSSIVDQLSAIEKPEVIDVTSRAAKIIWVSPVITDTLLISMQDLRYNVLLSDTGKQCKYKSLYKGEAYECIVQDLQPGQDYLVRLQVHYQKLQGTVSEPTEFKTPPCEPDQPQPPKLVSRTKNSINLRWSAPAANGSSIAYYLLETDEGKGNTQQFVELAKTKAKHYLVNKLQPTTVYSFRLAAVNEVGQSLYSEVSSYSTAGNPPAAPKAPTLQAWSPGSLCLAWERRAQDGDFLLQMQDLESGHGYLNTYKGGETVYECGQLRRATAYHFRLRAENDAGVSPWSHEVSYKTAAERPGRPGKPHAKGKIHGTHFKARWEPPVDTGGAEILCYHLEINAGPKFERVYTGAESEAICERLQPGTTYQLRTYCEGPGGHSPYSDIGLVTTEAVAPAAPPPPYFDSPPTPYVALLRLSQPDYNGGAPVLEFEAQMRVVEERGELAPTFVYRGKQDYFVAQQLMPGCVYETQVRAINRIGAGGWSQWFRFTAAAAAPSVPEALRVQVKSATHVYVSWQPPTLENGAPISGYCLQSASLDRVDDESDEETEAENADEAIPSLSGSDFHSCYHGLQTSADIRNLAPFTRYFFRLFASNVAGDGPLTELVCVRTPAAVPAAPQMQGYEFTANEVTLNWTEPAAHGSTITSYNIEYGERTIATPDACTRYTVAGLMPETSYKFRVQAMNAIGAGSFSAYAKLTTQPAPPAPPTLECSGAGHNYIKLKWGEGRTNVDFTKYFVEMYVTRAKQFQVVYSGTNCMCKIHKLQERSTYTFRIYAHTDRAGDGDYSEEFIFETSATLPANIKAPRVIHENSVCLLGETSPLSGHMPLGMQLKLEWQQSKNSFHDRVEYELQYAVLGDAVNSLPEPDTSSPKKRSSSSGSNNSAPVALSNQDYRLLNRGPENHFTIDNLVAGTCYQFRVCPVRVTASGELLYGQPSTALRYQVPSELDPSQAACHHMHALPTSTAAAPLTVAATQRSSRKLSTGNGAANVLHQRSVSASAISHSSSSSNGGDALALSRLQHELTSNFTACGDPLHHHHHHHHHHHQPCAEAAASPAGSSACGATNLLLRGNSAAHHMHHNHHLHHAHHMHHAHHPHGLTPALAASTMGGAQQGALRRLATKVSAIYSNRKRFTDQQKAVIFVVSFLVFTFLVAMLMHMLFG